MGFPKRDRFGLEIDRLTDFLQGGPERCRIRVRATNDVSLLLLLMVNINVILEQYKDLKKRAIDVSSIPGM